MLKSTQTWIASSTASSLTPAARSGFHVRRSHVRWGERELLEEAEGRTQLGIERSGAPISQDCLDQGVVFLFLLQGQRRDRAVSAGSEQHWSGAT